MTFTRVATVSALLFCCAGPASGQTVRLEFHDGKVNLIAQNAPLRTILAESARLGGSQVVNAERLTGAPVTLQLTDVPETQALDIILRGTAGYIAGQRTSAGPGGTQSSLDRIMVFPTAGTATTVAARPVGTAPPPFQPVPQAFVQPDPDDSDVPNDDRPNRGPRPAVPPAIRMVAPNGQGQVVAQPFVIEEDTPPAPTPAPSNPFGVTGGSARPGMPPPQPQPQRPPNSRDQEP